MNLKQLIEQDLKTALLSGDSFSSTTLKGLKRAIINAEIAKGVREEGLTEADTLDLLSKEAKKRQESADLYSKGGNSERAEAEIKEKELIEKYLPEQLSEEAIGKIVDDLIKKNDWHGKQFMGQIIASVKQESSGAADGATTARIVRER